MIATIRKSSFDLMPLSPLERCTPVSVAAHTLYEKTRPDRLPGPGGVLELDDAHYEQLLDGRTARISGARFTPSPVYQIKLEGVKRLGHRSIFIGGIRDPILIAQINDSLDRVRRHTQDLFPGLDQDDSCRLTFHVYGQNAVMGPLEPEPMAGHEIGIFGEVVAPTREKSHAIANSARVMVLHMPYENQLATTGNLASPLSPHEQYAREVFKFSLYHLIDLQLGEERTWFPVSLHTLSSTRPTPSDSHRSDLSRYQRLEAQEPLPVIPKQISNGSVAMRDIAKVIRSKNSGPFELTFDIMFDSTDSYQRFKSANLLTNETIKRLYSVEGEEILVNMYYTPALAWKCTLKRLWAQGSIGERDTLGTQQHAPLLDIIVPSFLS